MTRVDATAARPDPRLQAAREALRQRRLQQAYNVCGAVLATDPAHTEALFLMGRTLQEAGDILSAIDLLGRASQRDPEFAETLIYLARANQEAGRNADARSAALRALQMVEAGRRTSAGVTAVGLDTLGVVLDRVGEHARAVDAAKRAVALEPARGAFWRNLGWSELHQNGVDAARKAFRKAMALDPNDHQAPAALVDIELQTVESNLILSLKRLFAAASDPDRRLLIGHALAKSLEDLGQPEKAFDWLVRAKAAKRAATRYDSQIDQALFDAAAVTPPATSCPLTSNPIFVIGLPRSGTTLVDRIISSHPDVASVGEPSTMLAAVNRIAAPSGSAWLEPSTLDRAASSRPEILGRAYIDATQPLVAGGRRWLDKTPENYLFAGLIHRALPDARIVCVRRHPLDSVLSLFRQSFSPRTIYQFTYGLEDVARYYVMFDRLVAHWRATLPAERFCEIHYEDIVTDLEVAAPRLLDLCGLDWNEAALRPHENAAAVSSASAAQVRREVHSASVGRWRAYGERLAPAIHILSEAGLLTELEANR